MKKEGGGVAKGPEIYQLCFVIADKIPAVQNLSVDGRLQLAADYFGSPVADGR